MKSLKRTLCLVLALVMVLGLFGIASATSFTDDNDVQYKEAVEVVTGIGAIKGMDDGTFNPKGTITRAQAATMVARVALTAGVADNLGGITSSFTDVTVDGGFSWAIPSIEYLVEKNVINGMGDGTFNPNGEINGYAVLKMLLCALGYGAKDEYIGNQWTLQVAVDANNNKLTAGRNTNAALSNPATREEVALYCFNALNAKTVTYSQLDGAYKDAKTLGDKVYGLKAAEGVIYANAATATTAAAAGTTSVDTYTSDGTAAIKLNFKTTTGLDLLGHYVKVYYQDAATVPTGGYAVYTVLDESVVKTVATAITAGTGSTAKVVAQLAKLGFTADVGEAAVDNGTAHAYTVDPSGSTIAASSAVVGAGAKIVHGASDADAGAIAAGTYILHNDKIYAFITPTTYTASVVESYTAPTATATGSIKFTNNSPAAITIPKVGDTTSSIAQTYATKNVYSGIQAGDVITSVDAYGKTSIVKATAVTGAIDTWTDAGGGQPAKFVSGGTTYPVASANKIESGSTAQPKLATIDSGLVGKECTFYLAPNGTVIAAVPTSTADVSNLIYTTKFYTKTVTGTYGNTELGMVQGVAMDGTEVNYVVGLASASFVDDNAANLKKLFKATMTFNDTLKTDVATLTAPTGKEAAGNATSDLTISPANNEPMAKHYLNASTKYIYVSENAEKLTVSVATTRPTVTASSATPIAWHAVASDTNGNWAIDYVVIGSKEVTASSGIIYAGTGKLDHSRQSYVDAQGKTQSGYVSTVFIDGVETQVLTASASAFTADKFYSFSVASNGVYTVTPISNNDGVVEVAGVSNVAGTYISTYTNSTTNSAKHTNVDASGAFVVDVAYYKLTDDAKLEATQKASLADVLLGKVAYTYTTVNGVTKVTGVYYLGASPADYEVTLAFTEDKDVVANYITTAAAFDDEHSDGKYLPGEKVTVKATVVETKVKAETVTVQLTDGTNVLATVVVPKNTENSGGVAIELITYAPIADLSTLELAATGVA